MASYWKVCLFSFGISLPGPEILTLSLGGNLSPRHSDICLLGHPHGLLRLFLLLIFQLCSLSFLASGGLFHLPFQPGYEFSVYIIFHNDLFPVSLIKNKCDPWRFAALHLLVLNTTL